MKPFFGCVKEMGAKRDGERTLVEGFLSFSCSLYMKGRYAHFLGLQPSKCETNEPTIRKAMILFTLLCQKFSRIEQRDISLNACLFLALFKNNFHRSLLRTYKNFKRISPISHSKTELRTCSHSSRQVRMTRQRLSRM